MTDHPEHDHLAARIDRATPDAPPPFGGVLARRRQRTVRRRGVLASVTAVAMVAAGATALVVTTSDGAAPVVEDATATDAGVPTSFGTTGPAYPEPALTGKAAVPSLRLSSGTQPVEAQLGSYCWGNACADAAEPDLAALPDVGQQPVLRAAFPYAGQWSINAGPDLAYGCDTYPVLVEAPTGTTLDLTPAGPAGPRVGSFFVYPEPGGDVSGWWRWTVPERDGKALAWLSLTQNTASSGGAEDLRLVLDDAAVDGDVRATVTISSADGSTTRVPLDVVDQHCPGDGVVEVGASRRLRPGVLDGLGATPYGIRVVLVLDGTSYVGTGTFDGEHTVGGGDARLAFEPPLPALTR